MPGRLLITLQRQASAMRGLKHKRSSSHLLLWRSGESESTTTITDLCDVRPLINDCRRNSALTRRLQAWSMLARWSASSSWHWSCIWAHLATKNQIEIKPWISCPISPGRTIFVLDQNCGRNELWKKRLLALCRLGFGMRMRMSPLFCLLLVLCPVPCLGISWPHLY